ncbi:MAG: thioesterase [Synergistes sp.]|nr:thioesterase [Synergistes sp.]
MTEIENTIQYSSVDPKGRVKFSALLEMFQQMADVDASKYGLAVQQTMKLGISWVMRKYRVDLTDYPKAEDGNIVIKTFAEPVRNLYSLRSFIMSDVHGRYIGKAYTWWVLVDFATMRPLRLDRCEIMKPFMERITEELPDEVKIPALTAPDTVESWNVRWQDLDINCHTNHTVYFNWALESVPYDVPESYAPVFVEGEYLRPVMRTKVRCLTQEIPYQTGRFFVHSIRHADDDSEYARFLSRWR